MFETKIALVVRDDLQTWQKLNVTAFLMSGIVGDAPGIIGEPYQDASGNLYNSLCAQPVIILAASVTAMAAIHSRALRQGVRHALYIEDMFSTGHDAANRAAFAGHDPETAKVVGLGLRERKKLVDKITKGARLHA